MGERRVAQEEERWEEFAQRDPEWFVYTPRVGRGATKNEYFDHGREIGDRMLSDLGGLLERTDRAVEIGCGTGRVAIPLSENFKELIGTDIAPTMLSRLAENADKYDRTNIRTMSVKDAWEDEGAELVYCVEVFQHIEDFEIIRGYLDRVRTCIVNRGVAYLHFDMRPKDLSYLVKNSLPDVLLPRAWRRGIRRIRRSRAVVHEAFRGAGLEIVRELNSGTTNSVYIVRALH